MALLRVGRPRQGRAGGGCRVESRTERLDSLYRAEYAGMVRLAYLLVSDNADAEELVQESFVDVFRRLDEIRRPGAYLRTAVVSRCRSVLRRRRLVAATPPPRPAELGDEAGELWDVLDRLPDAQRAAVVLRYYGGLKPAEIAAALDLPGATVRSHLRRGLATMRKELER